MGQGFLLGGQCREIRSRPCDLQFRKPEVEKFRAGLREHDVPGFQIPVHDTLSMRFIERVGHLNAVLQGLVERKRAFAQSIREGLSLDMLHDDEVDAVLVADIVKGAYVRMVQARNGTGFALESGADVGVTSYVRGKHLDGRRCARDECRWLL